MKSIILIIIMAISAQSIAEEKMASDETIARYFAIIKLDESLERSINTFMDGTKEKYREVKIPEKHWIHAKSLVKTDYLRESFFTYARKIFTEEELDAHVKYMSSDVGASYARKMKNVESITSTIWKVWGIEMSSNVETYLSKNGYENKLVHQSANNSLKADVPDGPRP